MGQIRFTDITLREASRCGEGALSFKEIIEAAKILDRLNLDVISLAPIVNEKIDSLLVRTVAAAVKRSAPSWRPSCPNARPARQSISSMSRPPVCMSQMSTGLWMFCRSWWTQATRLLSSSTIWMSSRLRTISSTSVPRAATAAVDWSFAVRRRRLHSARVRIPDSISARFSPAKTAENAINKVEMCNKTGVS